MGLEISCPKRFQRFLYPPFHLSPYARFTDLLFHFLFAEVLSIFFTPGFKLAENPEIGRTSRELI
jgi:hypothetical protein